ncbi:MAG: hypothetical protein HGA61_03515 [Candidatus Moranbacteria bacterium]|nr:hypothetical protein [Candidatus Moranbacteria bacterium]
MLPSATDMGHHMYWTNMIVQEGNIPNYQQADVVFKNGNYAISQPQNISDFIIGEHLIFSAIALVSGLSVISYFPTLVLFVINIFSLLAIFILTLRLFEKSKEKINISILTLFLLGPLFALAPPQAKFISGGVVGNIIGNFLLPLTFYFFLRAMREKNKIMLLFALVFSMNLFYTHHLTALLFALSMIIVLLLFLVTNLKNILYILKTWSSLFFSLPVLSFLFFSFIFAFFVYTPTYITNQAVKTVIGSPKKIEHTGLSMAQFKDAIGEPRLALAIFGILILSYALLKGLGSQRKNFSYEKIPFHIFFLFGWIGAISTISLFPQLVKIGIPSARVANYGVYPFAITASFCLAFLFFKKDDDGKRNYSVRPGFFFSILTVIATYLIVSGFYDNSQNMAQLTSPQKINQTFNASEFLARNVSGDDQIQSDHIYIKADAWTKIFLMKDYNFPLYRANFERYENGIDKNEKCTLNMISSPNEPDSQKCFSDLNVKYIMVSGKNDSSQFQNNDSFWQIYSNNEINIYYRKAQ